MNDTLTTFCPLCFSPHLYSSTRSFSFPLPPCIIPLVMCQYDYGVQEVSSLKRMWVFFVPLFKRPSAPPLMHLHISLQLSFHRTYWCFPTVRSSQSTSQHSPFLPKFCYSLLVIIYNSSHTLAITQLKTLDCLV